MFTPDGHSLSLPAILCLLLVIVLFPGVISRAVILGLPCAHDHRCMLGGHGLACGRSWFCCGWLAKGWDKDGPQASKGKVNKQTHSVLCHVIYLSDVHANFELYGYLLWYCPSLLEYVCYTVCLSGLPL
jgi:hypothetical protein